MNTIPEELENYIYKFVSIHDKKFINSKNFNLYLKKLKSSKILLNKNIINYLNKFKLIRNEEHEYYNKLIWKKYYPMRHRIPMIKLSLKKLNLTAYKRIIIFRILESNDSIVDKYNEFINLLDIEEITYIGW